jgi:probable F420-dependent oxidoreductase
MHIGFNLPISGTMAAPETLLRIAREGEAIGYDYLTLTDHIVLPDTRVPGYPYSESGTFYEASPEHRYEQLTTAAFLAAATQKIRLVLAVMVVPHRPAVLAAKMLATIDVLSGGRLTVGIGAGWLEREFEAVVATPFAERGAVTDETIRAFRTLWTEDRPHIEGRWVKCNGLLFAPKPVQKPHPPIWVGGESGPSLRRTARLGDAWYPIGSNNRHLLDTLPRFSAEAGRDPAAVGLAYRVKRYGAAVPDRASDGERRLFSGSTADIIADFRALRALGVGAIDIDFERADAQSSLAEMRRFHEEVITRI